MYEISLKDTLYYKGGLEHLITFQILIDKRENRISKKIWWLVFQSMLNLIGCKFLGLQVA
jgi:hypothetical protein